MGDIVVWDFFRSQRDTEEGKSGNQHVGFYWSGDQAVSMARENPCSEASDRSPQFHPLYFDGPNRKDGPRKILSIWAHPKLRTSYAPQAS